MRLALSKLALKTKGTPTLHESATPSQAERSISSSMAPCGQHAPPIHPITPCSPKHPLFISSPGWHCVDGQQPPASSPLRRPLHLCRHLQCVLLALNHVDAAQQEEGRGPLRARSSRSHADTARAGLTPGPGCQPRRPVGGHGRGHQVAVLVRLSPGAWPRGPPMVLLGASPGAWQRGPGSPAGDSP